MEYLKDALDDVFVVMTAVVHSLKISAMTQTTRWKAMSLDRTSDMALVVKDAKKSDFYLEHFLSLGAIAL